MAAPAKPTMTEIPLAMGESDDLRAQDVADRIQNLLPSPEGGLQSVRGPALFEPGANAIGRIHGLFFAGIYGGAANTIIVRAGTSLWMHRGWARDFLEIETGLTETLHQAYPDQFVLINNVIVWTNGVDAARVISHDGIVFPLGFDGAPSTPSAEGPEQPDEHRVVNYYPNSDGVSWPGPIGTQGDVLHQNQGKLMAGSWYYGVQYKDPFGNVSPISALSESVDIAEIATSPLSFYHDKEAADIGDITYDKIAFGATLDQLTRQFFVRIGDNGPSHAVGYVLGRTQDTKRNAKTLLTHSQSNGHGRFALPDNIPDAGLGDPIIDAVPVPVFSVMCTHEGCLVIGNLRGLPGMVRQSRPDLFGTFDQVSWVRVSQTDEVTALCSHQGMLIAFTEQGMFDITGMKGAKAISQGIGCAAPRSIKSLPDGSLTWRAVEGWYIWNPKLGEAPILSSATHRILVEEGLNTTRIRHSMAAYDSKRGMYLCAVASASSTYNDMILGFSNETGWSRFDYGVDIGDITTCEDRYKDILLGAHWTETDPNDDNGALTLNNLLVLYKETDWAPPARVARFRTKWFRADEPGRLRFNANKCYLTFMDSWANGLTMTARTDMEPSAKASPTVRIVGTPLSKGTSPYTVEAAVVGTVKLREPRLGTRIVGIEQNDIRSLQLQLDAPYPAHFHIIALALATSRATNDVDDLVNANPKAMDY